MDTPSAPRHQPIYDGFLRQKLGVPRHEDVEWDSLDQVQPEAAVALTARLRRIASASPSLHDD